MTALPHYIDDPRIDEVRKTHRLHLDPHPVESALRGWTVYAAWCTGTDCPWISRSLYDDHGQHEQFDQHLRDLQQTVHGNSESAGRK
ncbi:hypothetical protein [Streptomyces sp. NPDC048496]|uniref:hypothetical protein n=1 Tax=Streptomyces sp. NPDC048496 TaxID=3365558 RepID=UPI003711AFE0